MKGIKPNMKLRVLTRDKNVCQYCGATKRGPLTVDHVVPRSHGGKTGPVNLVACCKLCNKRKGANRLPLHREAEMLTLAAQRTGAHTGLESVTPKGTHYRSKAVGVYPWELMIK